jgi:tRNA-splicing ligase RtcB
MGTASYILVGRNESEEKSFSSSAHGAGRVISRMKAKEKFSAEKIIEELNKNNILIETASKKGLVEEAPEVYKDIEEVIKVSENSKLTKKIARLIPIAVIKG